MTKQKFFVPVLFGVLGLIALSAFMFTGAASAAVSSGPAAQVTATAAATATVPLPLGTPGTPTVLATETAVGTATSALGTATSVLGTATVGGTVTAGTTATAEVTTTVVGTATAGGTSTVVGTATAGGTTTVVGTTATTVATSVGTSTMEATAMPTEDVGFPTPEVVPTVIGMPSTGAPDTTLFLVLVLFGMSLLAIGLVARRSIAGSKR